MHVSNSRIIIKNCKVFPGRDATADWIKECYCLIFADSDSREEYEDNRKAMTGNEFIIIFKQDKAFLTSNKPLSFKQLNLPPIVKSFKSAFWKIKILNCNTFEKNITAEIISYEIGVAKFPSHQLELADKLNEVETVNFCTIDTFGLLRTTSDINSFVSPQRQEPQGTKNETAYEQATLVPKEPVKHILKETFFIPFKNIRFKLGGVSFDKKFSGYDKKIEITILNYDVREEFDAIKNYFANILNTKKIQVAATVEIVDNQVLSVVATSPEIQRINSQIIENVKFEFLKKIVKTKISAEINKTLFTMDEYFDTFADNEFKSNSFYSNEKELFEDILTISNTKHYKHLRFLSSKHSHDIMKLRFVHKPFSFIFLLTGNEKYHIIWETLDTEEATYIWHIDKDISILKMTLRKIESIINTIKVHGKTAYISDTDDPFRRIYHDYSEIVEGFVKWKGELESVLN